MDNIQFAGTIAKVSRDGGVAVVRLNQMTDGVDLAVISPETQGRVKVVGRRGQLIKGQKVVGVAQRGPDALKVIKVELAKSSNK